MLITETVDSIEKPKQETTVSNYLSHNDVVKMIGVQFQSAPYMIMEFMANGDLISYMTSNADSLQFAHQVKLVNDTAAGFTYLQSRKFIHRDLAARNFPLSDNFHCQNQLFRNVSSALY